MWVSSEEYVKSVATIKTFLEGVVEWQSTHAAQLDRIIKSQERLETNVGQRLAEIEKQLPANSIQHNCIHHQEMQPKPRAHKQKHKKRGKR